MRVLCGGQVVDDFDYARTESMMHILHSEAQGDDNDIESFGARWDDAANDGGMTLERLQGIASGSYQRVSFKPLSG